MTGFFSPTAWSAQRQPLRMVADCQSCGLYKQGCTTPKMKAARQGRRKVLIVGEAPGATEDRRGIQFVGPAGMELHRLLEKIGVSLSRDCWTTNAVICYPHTSSGHREPTPKEVDWCRPNLLTDLYELKPNVVIPMGAVATRSLIALAWKDGEVSDMGTWVGWQIPSIKLNTWICPTYHPSYLMRMLADRKQESSALELHMTEHLQQAFAHDDKPYPDKVPDWNSRVTVEMDHHKAAGAIRSLTGKKPVAFDYETNMLKPDSKDAEIICCSVSDGSVSIAYPWYGEAIQATRELLLSNTPKVSHNLKFEDRWTRRTLGITINNWHHDTMLAAHWLDCRRGICSLKFQAFVRLGWEDYDSHLKPYMEAKDSNSPNRLREVEPAVLLRYNALDSLVTMLLYKKQMEE